MLASERHRQEDALRRAVLAGDEAAWRTLYDGAYAGLWAYVVWRCAGLRDLAEEVTQETWLVAVRRIGEFDPERGRFVAWLRGIAAKVVQNRLRAQRQHTDLRLSGQEEATDDRLRCEQAELIARALSELPDRYEAALRAKYLDLQSVEAIAAEWSESSKAIESLLTRARQAFREVYERLAGSDVAIKESKP